MHYKKYFLIILLTLFVTSMVCAQYERPPEEIETILNNNNLSKKEKQQKLFTIANGYPSLDVTLKYGNEALKIAKELKDSIGITYYYKIVGIALRGNGQLEESLKNLFYAAKLASNYNLTDALSITYGEIANSYIENQDYENAFIYLNKSITLNKKTKNYPALAGCYIIMGEAKYDLGKYNEAMHLYTLAQKTVDTTAYFKQDTVTGMYMNGYIYGNKGLVFYQQQKYFQSEKLLLKAISMLEVINDGYGQSDYNIHLANTYHSMGKDALAITHATKGLAIAKELKLNTKAQEAFILMATLFKKQQNYKEALHYYKLQQQIADSIHNSNITKNIANLRTQFEVNLKQNEINILEKENKINQFYSVMAIIGLLLTLALGLLFWQRWKNIQLQNTTQKHHYENQINTLINTQENKTLQAMVTGQENERKRLAVEVQKELGTLLQTIKTSLENTTPNTPPDYKSLDKIIEKATNNVRTLTHSLNMGISQEYGIVPALEELLGYIQQTQAIAVEFTPALKTDNFGVNNEILIYHMVQELVSNILKHAKATKLSVNLLYLEPEKTLNIIIEDNGVGFNPENMTSASGSGLQRLNQIIKQFQGSLNIDSSASFGTSVCIDLIVTTYNATA